MSEPTADAIVVGGGIAGIAAALTLADRGLRVRLLEATRRLGGRATSHIDPLTGEEIDNCQHVTMGACSEYNALLERLGAGDSIEWTSEQTWIERGGRTSTIRAGRLPPPLHYAAAFAAARFLSPLDKVAIAAAMPLIAVTDRHRWTDRTFLEFLLEAGQPESAIRRFWSPVVVSACNMEIDRVSAAPALMVFQNGLLQGPEAARIGVPRVPLGRLYASVPSLLAEFGGSVEYGQRVGGVRVEPDAGGIVVTLEAPTGRVELHAPCAVVAVGPSRLPALLPAPLLGSVPGIRSLGRSAIIGVHLRVNRSVLSVPHAVLVERQTQWVFRKDVAGRAIHAVISAAPDALLALPEEAVAARVWDDVAACIPAARDAEVLWMRVIKNRQATFAATPEAEAQRPAAGPLHDGCPIALAGDYTRTGWPATMEGAARSGRLAAEALLSGTVHRC